ncbi:MAG TPA: alpha/beta hydrolase [Candidatus Udaeobacter sp.]|jgi:pimeloyl-ACP methyl ester carboxylesterase|nr:alpha/beta hydrolase [Candidatus Udaeobacter sp.]
MGTESLPAIQVDGAEIFYRRVGSGPPLLVLNGFAATSADWDPAFIDGLASCSELILLNHRGIGGSTEDGRQFDIPQLTNDVVSVIETLGLDRANVLGWSMGGFIAQTLALEHPNHVRKLILLSTDAGGTEAVLASPDVWTKLIEHVWHPSRAGA